ncbi:MAG TPA: ATP-binding protein [Gemmatimonadaceae bacterium]|nr:ATP-binding protein [Gemmatimonadaceae bacterium]
MRLAQRLLLYSFLLIAVLVIAISAIVDSRLRNNITDENAANLAREARLVAVQWTSGADPDSLADATGNALQRRVTLIDSSGVVVGDSKFDGDSLRSLQNHSGRPEVIEARRTGTGISRRVSPSRGDEELYVAVRAGTGIARVSVGTGTVDEIFDAARRDIITAGLIALVGAMLIAFLFARNVSRPIIELRDVAQSLAARDFGDIPVTKAPGEVGELADSLHRLSIQLEALEKVRRDFVANVSHELRTPLTIVGGFAETLAEDDPPAATRKEFAAMILENTHRMQRIVDDLLDLSRIESGGWIPKPTQVSVPEVIDDVVSALEPAATAKGLTIRTYIPANAQVAYADRTAIRQILANLVENAIRHTSQGVITIFSEPDPQGTWVGVRDTGEGISQEHLSRIFERFYRVDSGRSREQGGTGLGLAIVRHMTEAHGGRVRATSRVDEGTAIATFFPFQHPGAAEA